MARHGLYLAVAVLWASYSVVCADRADPQANSTSRGVFAVQEHERSALSEFSHSPTRRKTSIPDDGTLMFLHVFKCAGSTLRKTLCDWAKLEDLECANVAACGAIHNSEGTICLRDHNLLNKKTQERKIARKRVIAGHFTWGFQVHVKGPYSMITMLRRPLETQISGFLYLHRKSTPTLASAVNAVSNRMLAKLGGPEEEGPPSPLVGYIYRLVHYKVRHPSQVVPAAAHAMRNLEEFWLVGVLENYEGFSAVLRTLLDPKDTRPSFWRRQLTVRRNKSRLSTHDVMGHIDPALLRRFNATLDHQWAVYNHAVGLFEARCQEVLPPRNHAKLCRVAAES